jgi:hypothetical protein
MLDTIAIKITYPSFMVGNPNLFTPALNINDKTTDFNYGRHKFQKFIQNGTLADKQAGIYLPRLTVYKRFEDYREIYDLHIEFSVPKLLNNNSVQEYDEADFDKVISILKARLTKMEIRIFETLLRKAIVVKAHFGKNIPLPPPMTVQDAAVQASMASLRSYGETYYAGANTYTDFCLETTPGTFDDPEVEKVEAAIDVQTGLTDQLDCFTNSDSTGYAAQAPLPTGGATDNYFCVDSGSQSLKTTGSTVDASDDVTCGP